MVHSWDFPPRDEGKIPRHRRLRGVGGVYRYTDKTVLNRHVGPSGLAIATEVDPDILLVDEILAVGDQLFQKKCLERIDNFRRKGKTTVFVSHDMGLVQSLCERILLLDHGRLQADGPAEQVIARYHELLENPASAATI